jgi:uncharacterized membrane protein YhaH (DUF805 family)
MSKAWAQYIWPSGRINRAPYWVFGFLSNLMLEVLEKIIPGADSSLWYGIIIIPVGYIGTCLMIGRLHDINQSGWWALPLMLAMAGFFVLFGGQDAPEWIVATWTLFFIGFGGSFYVGLKPGTDGANRFGPSPFEIPA